MLMTKDRRPAFRTIEGWARAVLLDAGAIRECEEHGWMRDRADPHARQRAVTIARGNPPSGVSPDEAAAPLRTCLARLATPVRSARPRDEHLSDKGPRRLQAAGQRRLDCAHVPPAVEGFAGKENRPTINS
jgi:hypothetical protein